MHTNVSNHINHIALVLDASGSMNHFATSLIQVVDQQVQHLAQRSKEMDQETRVTAYTFNAGYQNLGIKCLFYDKDVLRLPSLRGLYVADGQTPLIDATMRALDDLSKTPELYGDHAFLTYVLTDGQENASRIYSASDLVARLQRLKDNWTVGCFVPDARGVHEAKSCGFLRENISVWDATSTKGVSEMGSVMRQTTDAYMTMRASGVRGSRSLFTLDTTGLSKSTLKRVEAQSQHLTKLTPGQFRLLPVTREQQIAPFVESHTMRPYVIGEAFYQLTKPVVIQASKQIAVYVKGEHTVYVGRDARQLLGLPDYEVKVSPISWRASRPT